MNSKSTAESLSIVGIGASAGGLSALKKLFSRIPEKSGLAYVVVVHLSPDHKSILAELLQPHIKMPVQQVNETVMLERDHVYVIPPGCNLESVDTHLRLSDLEKKRGERTPIDHFFRTMANTHDGNSIGVILTGTGSDGALGLKEIKLKGGLTIVQDPYEAEFDGMPQSSISTGIVDTILSIEKIPDYILNFTSTKPRIKSLEANQDTDPFEKQIIQKIYAQVRTRTGRDFSRYKLSTILRRLERRMQIYQIEQLEDYLVHLRSNAEEVRALSDDFLINVTSFFRDMEVFQELENSIIPSLFNEKGPDDQVRVWSVGCASGEEAYSLAMLLYEEASKRQIPPSIQLFASDLHEASLSRARDGFYPGDIEADVTPERLRRFFYKEDGGYRVRKELREMVVFTPHNLLGDPPFSRMNLIVCRNLLIYLKREVQRDVFELFHYALQKEGALVLGSSEHLESTELFRTVSKELSIYFKRDVPGPEPRLPVFPQVYVQLTDDNQAEKSQPFQSYGALHQRIVEQYAPPSILISSDYQIIHVSETAGRYLTISGGELSRDIFKLIRPAIHLELRAIIYAARDKNKLVRSNPIPVSFDGTENLMIVSARVVENTRQDRLTLVMFEEFDLPELLGEANAGIKKSNIKEAGRIKQLESELQENRQRLQAIIEEYETSREEMKASNEELQSANEELRSTMEELETSKEELQSMNEELTTLNQENRHKVKELGQLSDDLNNLLAATDIATLFLDKELRILQFTPKLGELFNVRLADRGRLITDQTNKLGYVELADDARKVLKSLIPIVREVSDRFGSTYLTRVLPYRSAEDRIDGVVITFVDITERKKAEEALQESELRYRLLVKSAREYAIFMVDMKGRIMTWNTGSERLFGYTEDQVLGKSESIIYTREDREAGTPEADMKKAIDKGQVSGDRWYIRQDGSRFWASGSMETLSHTDGSLYGFTRVLRDNSERKEAEEALKEEEWRHQQALEAGYFGTWDVDLAGNNIRLDGRARNILRLEQKVLAFGELISLIHPADREEFLHTCRLALDSTSPDTFEWVMRIIRRDGSHCWVKLHARILNGDSKRPTRALGLVMNVTSQVTNEEELTKAKEEAEKAARVKDDFLSTMSHEIRTPLNAINGLTHLLLQKSPRTDQIENLETLKFSTHNLLGLINDILYFSKLEAKKVEIEAVDYELSTLLKSIRQAHLPMSDSRHNTLRFDLNERIPPVLKGDPNKLSQVIHNLVSNAIKFTENGNITMNVDIEDEQKEGQVLLVFSVKDNGVGISEKKQKKIFDKFTQADSSTMRRYGGTGLGLTITRSILEMMGSEINVKSQEGIGAEFYFTLWQAVGDKNNIDLGQRIEKLKQEKIPIGDKKILLVEDADVNRMVIQQHLNEWWELRAEEALNGNEAVELARRNTYDIILMDMRMPELDGSGATALIRNISPYYAEVPIIILTADISIKDSKEIDLFDAVITKPFDPEHLMGTILRLLGRQNDDATPAEETPVAVHHKEEILFTPDLSHIDKTFENSEKERKAFYETALKTLSSFKQDFFQVLEAEKVAELNDLLHSTKMLFALLGLGESHRKLYSMHDRLARGEGSAITPAEKEEVKSGLDHTIGLIAGHNYAGE